MWEILRPFRKTPGTASGSASGTPHAVDSPGALKMRKTSWANLGTVNFKDLNLSADDEDEEHGGEHPESTDTSLASSPRQLPLRAKLQRNKLIIIMVGLPGRGKTFLCNKLVCYLNWLGHQTKLFNVGSYRRQQKCDGEVQNASFFDRHNAHGMEMRERALMAALDDLTAYLNSDQGQVAIFDATNTTNERRQLLIERFHGTYQYLFIESICTDVKVLEQNYRYKMRYSPDYKQMDMDQALRDFKERIRHYEEVYEPLEDRTRHYIKLIDMVTGRGHMDINRISGYIPGKIVFFLMQVCKAGMAQERKIWLTRHGESIYNLDGKIGGDSGLAPRGEAYARALPALIIDRLPVSREEQQPIPVSVWTSTLKRTIQTAAYLPFPKLRWKALDEIHAGSCDGLTYDQISEQYPEEFEARVSDKLRYRYPAGESYLDVIQRLEPVIIEIEREKECVCVVAHQAVLRALYGYFMAVPLDQIPVFEIPLHTLIELQPNPDGTMQMEHVPMPIESSTAPSPSDIYNLMAHSARSKTPPQVPFGATPATGASGKSSLANSLRHGLFSPDGASASTSKTHEAVAEHGTLACSQEAAGAAAAVMVGLGKGEESTPSHPIDVEPSFMTASAPGSDLPSLNTTPEASAGGAAPASS